MESAAKTDAMTDLTSSDRPRGGRIGLFADGAVGARLLRYLADHHCDDIAWVVLVEGSMAVDSDWLEQRIGHGRVLGWKTVGSEAGLAALKEMRPTVVLLAWWPYLMGEEFLDIALQATLNLHPSLLPFARGKDPNFWSIVEDKPFGVTIHHATAAMDAGPIAFQREIPVEWTDTGGSLYQAAADAMYDLFVDSYGLIREGCCPAMLQDEDLATTHRRRELDAACLLELDRHYGLREVLNLLRARTFSGLPACRFVDGARVFEVRVQITEVDPTVS